MRGPRALLHAMRERRTSRLGPAEADRLVAGDPAGPEHRGLAALLDAAKAPASPRELAGERAAVVAFGAAYREAEQAGLHRAGRRARMPLPAKAAAVKVAAVVAVLAGSGVALAAETGQLPAGAQHQAHRLFSAVGVPAPQATSARARRTPSATPSPRASARPTPGASATGRGSTPGAPAVPGLCKAWAAQQEPHGKAMKAASRQALIAAAGGADQIAELCAEALATPGTTPAPSAKPGHGGKPDHPGKPSDKPGKGKDKTHTPGKKK